MSTASSGVLAPKGGTFGRDAVRVEVQSNIFFRSMAHPCCLLTLLIGSESKRPHNSRLLRMPPPAPSCPCIANSGGSKGAGSVIRSTRAGWLVSSPDFWRQMERERREAAVFASGFALQVAAGSDPKQMEAEHRRIMLWRSLGMGRTHTRFI